MGFKSEETCFNQVWVGERKGKGGQVRCSCTACTMQHIYIGLPASSCSQFSYLIWGYASGGCSKRRSLQGLFWQNTAYVGPMLCTYLHTYHIQSDTYSPPPFSTSNPETKSNSQSTPRGKTLLVIGIVHDFDTVFLCTIELLLASDRLLHFRHMCLCTFIPANITMRRSIKPLANSHTLTT